MSQNTPQITSDIQGTPPRSRLNRLIFRHLPVVLITAMLLIALVLELTLIPPLAWASKAPLALLLLAYVAGPFWTRRQAQDAGQG